jgi:hypothetical protein
MVVLLNINIKLIKILLNLFLMLHFSIQQPQSSYIDIDLTKSGYLTDKTGLINLNLSEIFLNKTRFNLTHNLNKYSIGFQLNNSTNQQCSNSIICEIIDTNNTHSINDIGTRIDHIKYESTTVELDENLNLKVLKVFNISKFSLSVVVEFVIIE